MATRLNRQAVTFYLHDDVYSRIVEERAATRRTLTEIVTESLCARYGVPIPAQAIQGRPKAPRSEEPAPPPRPRGRPRKNS